MKITEIANHHNERGQSLVLVALLLFIFMGLLALSLDAGFGLYQRRAMQNAADAGALAGARELCEGNGYNAAYDRAWEYAIARNGADDVPATSIDVNEASMQVSVTASITFPTFFGRVLGRNQMTSVASASAGCYSPCYGQGSLPAVWSCRPPVEGWDSDSGMCQQQRITWDTLQTYLADPTHIHPELYVIMDSETYNTDFMCVEDDPAGILTCDLDGDGESDWLASGGRSWVDLDGTAAADNCPGATGEGSTELSYWVTNGFSCQLNEHSWLPEQTGNLGNVFDATYTRWQNNEPLVTVPVNDDYCPDGDPRYTPECNQPPGGPKWHTGLDRLYPGSGSQIAYFHVDTFAVFYITCVRKNENAPNGSCPGIEKAKELNPTIIQGNSYKSIEGYFLEGYIPGTGGQCEWQDTGVYTLYLDH
jgi:hypothetical protein